MSFVGKKFPNLSVDAMNEMGDTFKVNVLEEAVNNKKKVLLFWYPKDFTYVCPTELHAFEAAKAEFEKETVLLLVHRVIPLKCILHGYPPQKTTEVLKV